MQSSIIKSYILSNYRALLSISVIKFIITPACTFTKKIRNNFFDDYYNWFLWIPFFQIIGIITFIFFRNLDSKYLILLVLLLAGFINTSKYIKIALIFVCIGFLSSLVKYELNSHSVISRSYENLSIKATVIEVNKASNSHKLLLGDIVIRSEENPNIKLNKLKLTIKGFKDEIKPGSRVYVKVNISPPAEPLFPGMYNFNLISRFEGVSAVGFAISKPRIYERQKDDWLVKIEKIRYYIESYISSSFDISVGPIMKALILGDTKEISDSDIDVIRGSGLAHVMAVSGLHIGLVVAFCFMLVRNLLALIPYLTLNCDLRKLAGSAAIIISFCYIMISGFHASAIRAFIMSSLVLIAIILDRNITFERTITVAAVIILLFSPESVIKPGFQMSFAAVSGLVFCYQMFDKQINLKFIKNLYIRKFFKYFLGICISSVIATIFTMPFTLYHFGKLPVYSIIANLAVLPVVSIIIMPFAIIFLFLYPIGSFAWINDILSISIKYFLSVAHIFGGLETSNILIPTISVVGLIALSVCIIGFWYFTSKLRALFGIIAVFILVITLNIPKPDISLINFAGNQIFIEKGQGNLVVVASKLTKFTKDIITAYYGINNIEHFKNCEGIESHKNYSNCLKFFNQSP